MGTLLSALMRHEFHSFVEWWRLCSPVAIDGQSRVRQRCNCASGTCILTLLPRAEVTPPGDQVENKGSCAKPPEQNSAAGKQEDELNCYCRQLPPAEQQIHYTECKTAGHASDRDAEARLLAGQKQEALAAPEEAITCLQESNPFFYEAELQRLRGVVALETREGVDVADEYLASALGISRSQGSLSLELRAALSLATMLLENGDAERGRALLA